MAKRKTSMMGMYNAEDYEEAARIWCNKNDILIYPKPCTRGSPSNWFLIISIKNKIAQAPDELPRNKVWEKMYEYYMYYYKKYNDERKISKV